MEYSTSIVAEVLGQSKAVMNESREVDDKIKAVIKDGPDKLQVITDFDSTLTKSHVNGEPTTHSIDVLNKTPTLSQEFETGRDILYQKYNDLVYGSDLTEHEKQDVLNKWWTGYVELLGKEHITLDEIQQTAELINTPLRDGCHEMFSLLSAYKVPVIVVSAGVGDVVSHTLRSFQSRIIANFLEIGAKGQVLGFKEPYTSVYNKHKISLPVESSRHNVILMGDSLGDCNMADNVPNTKIVLKIGFCSTQDQAVLEKYRNRYDIVLIEDETMDFPNALLRLILVDS